MKAKIFAQNDELLSVSVVDNMQMGRHSGEVLLITFKDSNMCRFGCYFQIRWIRIQCEYSLCLIALR